MITVYLKIALLVGVFFGGWMVNGWRMDSNHKDAMEQLIEDHTAQRTKDLEKFTKDAEKEVEIRTVFETIKEGAANVPTTPDNECTVDVSYSGVWNSSNSAIKKILSSALHDPLRTAVGYENQVHGLQKGGGESSGLAQCRVGNVC